MVGWTKPLSFFYFVKVFLGYFQTLDSCWNYYFLEPFHIKVLLYWVHLHWWIMARNVCSLLWVAAPKCLVGDLSWHLHKAGYYWVFCMETIFQWIDLKVTSKKSVVVKFVSIVIFSPSLWKIGIASFLQRLSLSSFAFSITDNPSSLYKPMFSLSMMFDNFRSR